MKRTEILFVFTLLALCLGVPLLAHGPDGEPGQGPGGGPDDDWHGFDDHHVDHNLVLPQIAVGQHYTTTLFFANLGNSQRMPWAEDEDFETRATVYFFRQDGNPYTVLVNGQGPVSEFAFSLGAGGSITLKLTGQGEDLPGWALVEIEEDSSGDRVWGDLDDHEVRRGMRLMATAFYALRDEQSRLASQVGVVPAMYEPEHFFSSVMAAQAGPDLDTGVAIVNTNAEELTVTLRLKDSAGDTIATTELSLAAGQQTARFITELFPGQVPVGFQGVLEVSTEGEGIVTLGLLMAEGVLTSIPSHRYGTWDNDQMGGGGGMGPHN